MGTRGLRIDLETDALEAEELLEAAGAALQDQNIGGFEVHEEEDRLTLIVAPDGPLPLDAHGIVAALRFHGLDIVKVSDHTYSDIDWSTHWRIHFQPLRIGRLQILPTWCPCPDDAAHVLWLDPSMAFGTGLHPSTRLILHRLEALSDLPPRVFDVGTGSGILALAALMLGAQTVHGVDVDPEAVRVARENAERNRLADRSEWWVGDLSRKGVSSTYPLVMANILAEPLVEMAPVLSDRVASGGRLLLSGLLGHQSADVNRAYEKEGLSPSDSQSDGDWVMLEFLRPS
ncbi:MAG: 50S ribosomal protein L11 methyltransferase [Myxococcota bacterium]